MLGWRLEKYNLFVAKFILHLCGVTDCVRPVKNTGYAPV